MQKKTIFSGIQPSGNLHLGNYLGAIKNWVGLQEKYESIFCVVDMHAITVPQDPKTLREKTLEIAKIYLAAGIDPKKATLFIQSHVPQHAELMWILNTITKTGELSRMTQFKDKAGIGEINTQLNKALSSLTKYNTLRSEAQEIFFSKKTTDAINDGDISQLEYYKSTVIPTLFKFVEAADAIQQSIQNLTSAYSEEKKDDNVLLGLFNYPVLMAADILLYDTQLVPVGEDQMQHIELTRVLGRRFNERFGDTFVIPEGFVRKEGMKIMGLDNPEKKMSKSAASEYNYISLIDDEDTVRRKIKKAVTDSGTEIVYSEDKPALKNLLNIYSLLSDQPIKTIEKEYAGKGYGQFKDGLADVVVSFLKPFQKKMKELTDEETMKILAAGAEKLLPIAEKKMKQVKKKVGFIV